MRPLVVFGDARAAAVDVLRAGLHGRGEPYAQDVTVGSRVPGDRSPETPRLPLVVVAVDDDRTHYPLRSVVLLRLAVWHVDADAAHDLAQLCRGLLCVHSGPVIRTVNPAAGVGPIVGVDPDTGIDLATTTVEAHVRPTRLAS